MKILNKVEIQDNIITCIIKAEYNNPLTAEEEREIETLHDYIRKLNFADIDFAGDIDMSTGMPIVANAATDETTNVVLPPMLPKEFVIDENLEIRFSLDVSRIPDSELSEKLNTKILMGQARAAVFNYKVGEKLGEILAQMRKEDNDFEGVVENIL